MLQIEETGMTRQRLSSRAIALLLFACGLVSSAAAADRVVDLTALDGTKLKATYFSAAKPGPGVLLLHHQ